MAMQLQMADKKKTNDKISITCILQKYICILVFISQLTFVTMSHHNTMKLI